MSSNSTAPIVRTELFVQSSSTDFVVPGDLSIQQVQAAYATSIPGLSNMVAEETIEFRPELNGRVRMITFKPRTGTKGSF